MLKVDSQRLQTNCILFVDSEDLRAAWRSQRNYLAERRQVPAYTEVSVHRVGAGNIFSHRVCITYA